MSASAIDVIITAASDDSASNKDAASDRGSESDVEINSDLIQDLPEREHFSEYSIIEAIRKGDIKMIKKWIRSIEGEESPDKPSIKINEIICTPMDSVRFTKQGLIKPKGKTPLQFAALHGKRDIVEVLLTAGADPRVKNHREENAIHCAVQSDCDDSVIYEVVSSLLQHKWSPSIHESRFGGETPLLYAVEGGKPKTVGLLLKHGADPRLKDDGFNLLHRACLRISDDKTAAEVVSLLLLERQSIIDDIFASKTPLHYAVKKFLPKTVGVLLENGADPNKTDHNKQTPLHNAVDKGLVEAVDVLIQHGADIAAKDKYGRCPIHYALTTTKIDVFEHMVVSLKKSVNEKESKEGNGCTVLHLAVIQNKIEYVRILIKECDADYKIEDDSKKFPVHYACEHISSDFEDFIRLLYVNDESKYDTWTKTPLQIIACKNDKSLLEILIKYGADPSRISVRLATSSEEGTDDEFEKVVKFLTTLSELIKKPLIDEKGRNSLHIAFQNNAGGRVIQQLLKKNEGIDVVTDGSGKMPIHYMTAATPVSAVRAVIHIEGRMIRGCERRHKDLSQKEDVGSSLFPSNSYNIPGKLIFSVSYDEDLVVKVKKISPSDSTDMQNEHIEISLVGLDIKKKLHRAFYDEHDSEYDQVVRFPIFKQCLSAKILWLKAWKKKISKGNTLFREGWRYEGLLWEARYKMSFQEDNSYATCELAPDQQSPLEVAINLKRMDIVEVLLVNGAKVDRDILMAAVRRGEKNLVQVLIRHMNKSNLDTLLNEYYNVIPDNLFRIHPHQQEIITTPFRELVRKVPDAAREALQRSFEVEKDEKEEHKSVTFNYSLLEPWHPIRSGIIKKLKSHSGIMINPLRLMVEHKRIELLQHPVIASYLYRKWNKIGFWYYFFSLILFGSFLASLSLFSLIVNRPLSDVCFQNLNRTFIAGYDNCGSKAQLSFAFIFAIIAIMLALYHLILEIIQIMRNKWEYFKEVRNYGEIPLYIMSIIYLFVFFNYCGCPLEWQWQVGIFAVFLGWMNLITYVSKFPNTGIYVLIFYEIVLTFLKLISFSILLVLAFSLIFFMTFNNPEAETSVFSNIGHAFVKLLTMVSGELGFESLFNLEVHPSTYTPIPYHGSAFLIWIIFVVSIPIILNNMLTSLAVGDTEAIKKVAELKKLDLQVHTVLQAEEFLPNQILKYLDPEPRDDKEDNEEDVIDEKVQARKSHCEVKLEEDSESEEGSESDDSVRLKVICALNDPKSKGHLGSHPEVKVDFGHPGSHLKVKVDFCTNPSPWRRIQFFIWGGKNYMEQVKTSVYHEKREDERIKIKGGVETDTQHVDQDNITVIMEKINQLFNSVKSIEEKISEK